MKGIVRQESKEFDDEFKMFYFFKQGFSIFLESLYFSEPRTNNYFYEG